MHGAPALRRSPPPMKRSRSPGFSCRRTDLGASCGRRSSRGRGRPPSGALVAAEARGDPRNRISGRITRMREHGQEGCMLREDSAASTPRVGASCGAGYELELHQPELLHRNEGVGPVGEKPKPKSSAARSNSASDGTTSAAASESSTSEVLGDTLEVSAPPGAMSVEPRSASAVSHRETVPATDEVSSGGTQVKVAEGTEAETDVVADTERHPHLADRSRLARTLAAGGDDLSLADPLYEGHEGDELADPLIGLIVADRYRIVERIGRGGMGIVYRVEHVRIGKILAMKLLAGELSANKEIVRRFKLEALTVSKLSSPHTVQVFDYGVWNHLTYLVMELVEGGDLAEALRRDGPLPFARAGRLIVQICSSLAEAHQKGIVHRDIKPENIMIITDSRGVEIAKVLDFGLAKLRESTELNELTLQGSVVGTPYYMSPEQVHGDEVDGRTDVYSVGAVLFRTLTGTYPFEARSPMGMFTKHLTAEPPSAVDRAPHLGIPRGVSDVIQKCMAKDPADRFQSITALRDALVDELNALPLSSSDRMLIDDSGSDLSSAARAARRERRVEAVDVPADVLANSVIATREELERYERKLRRTRYGAWSLFGVIVLSGLGGAVYAYREGQKQFDGQEREPNNQASTATPLPLDQAVQAYLGKRIEPTKGDLDFFHFEVPSDGAASRVSLRVSGLSNMAMCSVLYRVGFPQPLAQYCVGRPRQDLVVSTLRLEPGEYLLAVSQDMSRGEDGTAPPVHENVSEPYSVTVSLVTPGPADEVEPNDASGAGQT
ncbi:MAG TPA: serine/threonine protein kinase, partial [Polyangiaceae bacterium]|nr:serine/threonine protein kinase [Polyangiaceae bacterium]